MKIQNQNRSKNRFLGVALGATLLVISACSKNDETLPMRTGIQRSALSFTEVKGEAHGDHFHGLSELEGSKTHTISFDADGRVQSGGHFHLQAEGIYRIELKAWDQSGKEIQNNFIANQDSAANYKAFLTGGNFLLNAKSEDGAGAIYQTRESQYGDGSAIGGAAETTGIVAYLRIGQANVRSGIKLSYILRRLESGEKMKITRSDWQDESRFRGKNVLRLNFEPHMDGAHNH